MVLNPVYRYYRLVNSLIPDPGNIETSMGIGTTLERQDKYLKFLSTKL